MSVLSFLLIIPFQSILLGTEHQFLTVNTESSLRTSEVSEKLIFRQDDCVFNNNYKELTKEWLTKSGIKKFIWDDSLNHAKFSQSEDTVFLTQGGCTHFGYTVEQRIYADKLDRDIEHWIKISIELSDKFGFEHYAQSLRAKKYLAPQSTHNSFWLDIPDDNLDDNLFYPGIEVRINTEYKAIVISKYFN
jgi:hypothetical protein